MRAPGSLELMRRIARSQQAHTAHARFLFPRDPRDRARFRSAPAEAASAQVENPGKTIVSEPLESEPIAA